MEQKTRINLSIDAGVIANIRDKGLNISGLCENYLKELILTFETKTIPENCKHKWTWPFATALGLAKECIKCRTIKRVETESYDETMHRANKGNVKTTADELSSNA